MLQTTLNLDGILSYNTSFIAPGQLIEMEGCGHNVRPLCLFRPFPVLSSPLWLGFWHEQSYTVSFYLFDYYMERIPLFENHPPDPYSAFYSLKSSSNPSFIYNLTMHPYSHMCICEVFSYLPLDTCRLGLIVIWAQTYPHFSTLAL